jgi:molybdopterin-guanine dinucleotide biosynthesis protein A
MDNKVERVSAAVLAGGDNLKIGGQNKAFIKIDGKPVIERILDVLINIFNEVIIVGDPDEFLKFSGKNIRLKKDIFLNAGPLGGIHTALSYSSNEAVFIVACDMPFLGIHLIKTQLVCIDMLHFDCLVPKIGLNIEPLHSIFRTSIKDKIKNYILDENELSISGFFSTVNTYYLDLARNSSNQKLFCNINTPDDLVNINQCYDDSVYG